MGEDLLWATKNGDMEQLAQLVEHQVRDKVFMKGNSHILAVLL